MKRRRGKVNKAIFFASLLLGVSLAVTAAGQPGAPGSGADPDVAPISGIEWLLLSGGLLGARKVFQRFRKQ